MEENRIILTEKQCNKIIKEFTGSSDFTINSFVVNPMSSQMEGLIGEQYITTINYTINNEPKLIQFFVKILNGVNKVMFEISKSIKAFEKEKFFYEQLVPEIESNKILYDFIPKSYLCENYAVVLEDLSAKSYRGTNKRNPLDLEHRKKCLEILAKFHVSPIVFELLKSKELGKKYTLLDNYEEMLEDVLFTNQDNGATRFFKQSVKGLFNIVPLVTENEITNSEFTKKLQDVFAEIMSSTEKPTEFRSTLLHGDLWSNNFLFKYDDTKLIDCKLIDFQIIKCGPPAIDVLQFILTNTRKNFRDKHHNELLKHYYNCFSALLVERNLQPSDILSEDEFMKSCEIFMFPAKLQAIVDRSITFMSDETFLDAARNEETFRAFLFEERGKYIVNSLHTNGNYKELMLEDMVELRSILFS